MIRNHKWRLFLAFWPNAHVRQAISGINRSLPAAYGRPVPDANLHLTLLFLGAVEQDKINQLTAIAAATRPLNTCLYLDRLQWWRRPGVVALSPQTVPPELLAFQNDLAVAVEQAGFPVEKRDYRPHVTLRRKAGRKPDLPEIRPLQWPLQQFCLVRSITTPEGARYEVIWQSKQAVGHG